MTEIALQTWDLGVGYRTRRTRRIVLEGLNLSVHRSELVCLLGPNGVGKSTLLRTIARMQPPLSGSLELGGMDQRLMTETELARRLGAVLTERVTVESLPARRIVELGRYPHSGWFGALTDRDRGVVDWALTAVNAQRLAAQDFSRLSDGERQRIMIARALAQEPVILVLDEPTAFSRCALACGDHPTAQAARPRPGRRHHSFNARSRPGAAQRRCHLAREPRGGTLRRNSGGRRAQRRRRAYVEGELRHEKYQHDARRYGRDQSRGRRARLESVGSRRDLRDDRRAEFESGVRAIDLRGRRDRGAHQGHSAGPV